MMLSDQGYFVLASLQDGPLHGYAIIKKAAVISGGRVKLATGTLYGVLDRLASNGLVVLESESIVDGRARRTYQLTHDGMSALRTEAERLANAAQVVRPKIARGVIAVRPA
jgi:PadR family transcriptional regulator, regulatory protein PadR